MMRLKKVNKFISKALMALGAGAILLSACKDDEPNTPDIPTGMLTVSDQTLSQNKIKVENVNLDQNGWVVVHASTAEGGPVVPEIISEPLFVEAGSTDNLELTLTDVDNLSDGDKLWVMLHTDDGTEGTYEFDGVNGFDAPILTDGGDIVMSDITISAASVSVENQAVSENKVVISEVNAAVDGWIVIHSGDAGGPVIGQTMVTAGVNTDVEVDLGENTFSGGEMLFPMLHIESPADGEYGFPDNGDGPEVFGEDVIVVGFETLAPSGSIVAENQIVQGNTITVAELTVNATAWVVVHASNETNDGPQVPEIISTPVQLEAGTNTDVEIEIDESNPLNEGDVIYIMLHTENGTIGEYEFDGANGFDGPITTQAITVEAPTGTFVANDQTLSAGKLIVESVTVGQPSWVVVHRDDGTGEGFVAPGIISEPVAVEAGTTTDVEITFTEEVADGEILWVMLHNDNGTVGTYEFDGANGFDNPISFSSLTVSVSNVINYDVTHSGTSAYLFSGNGLNEDSNPDITLTRGETYTFTISASGHPFYIKSVQSTGTADAYNDGVENNGAQSGTITFTVPANAPSTLFYNCEFHASMTGRFTIID
ncbi:hypothetical protein JKA74_05955 [Marivirga sp. S37H4]|uniref:DUF7282 domain-containing protein n=1 Tax=Marivirga aurantiaca TaxID=2802615 RepID=A0A934WX72_9BACT|nr:hypothetical protein [Marivirga aurantiaca]MBK6264576.1 hypothetical protein [Marivirga aurantiaca]